MKGNKFDNYVQVDADKMRCGYKFVASRNVIYMCTRLRDVETGVTVYGHTEDKDAPDGWFTVNVYLVDPDSMKVDNDPIQSLIESASLASADIPTRFWDGTGYITSERIKDVKEFVYDECGRSITDESAFIIIREFHLYDDMVASSYIGTTARACIDTIISNMVNGLTYQLTDGRTYALLSIIGFNKFVKINEMISNNISNSDIYKVIYG